MCCFGSNPSLLKSSGELDLPLFFWNICCLPGELSGSTCQPARSQQLHMAVPCSGLVPRDPSETREMSQGTNPLKHFLKSNGGNKTSSHHKTKADKRWNVFKSCWGSGRRRAFKIVFTLTRCSGCQDSSHCWTAGRNGHFLMEKYP